MNEITEKLEHRIAELEKRLAAVEKLNRELKDQILKVENWFKNSRDR